MAVSDEKVRFVLEHRGHGMTFTLEQHSDQSGYPFFLVKALGGLGCMLKGVW